MFGKSIFLHGIATTIQSKSVFYMKLPGQKLSTSIGPNIGHMSQINVSLRMTY